MNYDIVKEEIWALEEAYFTNLYNADCEEVLAVVHGQFLAWPDAEPQPIDREGSALFMRRLFPEPVSCNIRIEREGIRVLGDVALTQFMVHIYIDDSEAVVDSGDTGATPDSESDGATTETGATGAKATIRSSRITHTWVNEGGRWNLLGGMSCDRETEI